mmetsp:Transcript_28851/g.72388  ORF Transcript_28851/g.72388 Transcript_28851/m.72388 type:complete len:211 (-) Transcript_28851:349-981(-)
MGARTGMKVGRPNAPEGSEVGMTMTSEPPEIAASMTQQRPTGSERVSGTSGRGTRSPGAAGGTTSHGGPRPHTPAPAQQQAQATANHATPASWVVSAGVRTGQRAARTGTRVRRLSAPRGSKGVMGPGPMKSTGSVSQGPLDENARTSDRTRTGMSTGKVAGGTTSPRRRLGQDPAEAQQAQRASGQAGLQMRGNTEVREARRASGPGAR